MDWDLAIRRNREALSRILAALFALVGLAGGGGMIAYAPSPARSGGARVLSPRGEEGAAAMPAPSSPQRGEGGEDELSVVARRATTEVRAG